MSYYVRMDLALFTDLRVKKAARKLACSENEILGALGRLWAHAFEHCPDGIFWELDEDDLCTAMGVEEYVFIEVLVKTGLLSQNSEGVIFCEGWERHTGEIIKKHKQKQEQNARRQAKFRASSGEKVTLDPALRNAPENVSNAKVTHPSECIRREEKGTEKNTFANAKKVTLDTALRNARHCVTNILTEDAIAPRSPQFEILQSNEKVKSIAVEKKKKEIPETNEAWEAYRSAISQRYHVEPARNAMTGGLLKQFIARVGRDNAPLILRFFVLGSNNSYYIQKRHSLKLAIADAETLVIDWQKGASVTRNEAQNMDKTATNANTYRALAEKYGWDKDENNDNT